ncbi:MAG: CHAT domain-containing protein [Bacteroidota bacterium]
MKYSARFINLSILIYILLGCHRNDSTVSNSYDAYRVHSLLLNNRERSTVDNLSFEDNILKYEEEKLKYLSSRSTENLYQFEKNISNLSFNQKEQFWINKDFRQYYSDLKISKDIPHNLELPLFSELKKCPNSDLVKYIDILDYTIRKYYDQGLEEYYISLQKVLFYILKDRNYDKKYPHYFSLMMLRGGLILASSTSSENLDLIKEIISNIDRNTLLNYLYPLAQFDYLYFLTSDSTDYKDRFHVISQANFHNSNWTEIAYASLIYAEISFMNDDFQFVEEVMSNALHYVHDNCEENYRTIQRLISTAYFKMGLKDIALQKIEAILLNNCERGDLISHYLILKQYADYLKDGCLSGNTLQCHKAVQNYVKYLMSFDSLMLFQEDGHYTDIITEALISKISLKSLDDNTTNEELWKDIQLTKNQKGIIKNRINSKLPLKWKKVNSQYNLNTLKLNKLPAHNQLTSKLNQEIYDDLIYISTLPTNINRKRGAETVSIDEVKMFNKKYSNLYLEYLKLSDSTFLRVTITDSSSHIDEIGFPSNLQEFAKDFKHQISKNSNTIYSLEYLNKNQELSKTLFQNIDLKKYNSLSFVGDDILLNLPIESLILKYQGQNEYLIDELYISYLHHSSHLFRNALGNIDTFSFLGFTDSTTLKSKKKKKFIDLPGIIKEQKILQEIIPNEALKIYSGYEATKDNLTKASGENLMHISTHGVSNTSIPTDNFMILRNDQNIEYFYGFEFQNIEIKSDIVIFSACDTGIGKIEKGEGINSFSKYLFENKVKSVISTQWKINDATTGQLFENFYSDFVNDTPILEALTNSKRKLKQNPKYAHPYYWAGFVLEGNPNIKIKLEE